MALQNFTTWTIENPDGEATVTSSKIEISDALNWDGNCRIYKDYGDNFFGTFTHQFEYTLNDEGVLYSACWGIYDNDNFRLVNLFPYPPTSSGYRLDLVEYSEATSDKSIDLSVDTKYYITVVNNGTSITCYIRTGSHTGVLIDTTSVNIEITTGKYVYMFYEALD